MSTAARRAVADGADEIATLRIELLRSRPLIWRQLEVPTSITLKVLHDIVQAALGWHDCHLWELTVGHRRYGPPADDGWGAERLLDAGKVRLRSVLRARKTVIDYLYDFGDAWEHRLTLSDVRAGDPALEYPRYLAGARNGPPEDCGGLPGFYGMIDAAADPTHPDHAEAKDMLEDYDPDAIDEPPIKAALSRIARRRNAATSRASKTR